MVTCNQCNKQTCKQCHEIKTKRGTTYYICPECYKKMTGKDIEIAGDSKESVRQHKPAERNNR